MGAVNPLTPFDARSGHRYDAEIAVPSRWPGRLPRRFRGAEVVAEVPMIRAEDDRRVLTRQMHQPPEYQIVETVATGDHVLVDFKVLLFDMVHSGRVIFHEAVTKVVDGIVVDPHEVPIVLLHDEGGCVVDADHLREELGEHGQPPVLLLIDLCGVGNEQKNLFLGQFARVES
jgi:hypothetical protein